MNVALLIPSLQMGGSERNLVLLAEVLAEYGFKVEIWLTGSGRRELKTTLRVIVVGAFATGGLGRVRSLIHRVIGIRHGIKRFRPNYMISFLESSNIPAIIAGRMARIPTILSVRGNPQRFNWFYRVMTFILYRYASSVVLPSREVSDYLARYYRLRNTVCIPNIHVGFSDSRPSVADKISGPLLAVGRLVAGKCFNDVIALAEVLSPAGKLMIIGTGPEHGVLESIAARSSISVTLAGALSHSEVIEALEGASVLLSMSASECWPNVIAEALAVGTPVIARDCNYGPREMIIDGRNGFLINSIQDIASRNEIRRSFFDIDKYENLCRNARESARLWTKERVRELWLAEIGNA